MMCLQRAATAGASPRAATNPVDQPVDVLDWDGVTVSVTDVVPLAVAVPATERFHSAKALSLSPQPHPHPISSFRASPLADWVGDADDVAVQLLLAVMLPLAVPLPVPLLLVLEVDVAVGVMEGVAVWVPLPDPVVVREAVRLGVGV